MDWARGFDVKRATVRSVCECQAKLGADLDEHRHVVRGWARDPRGARDLVAPAHSIGADRAVFDVAWACPWCTRNQTRLFSADALVYRDGNQSAAAAGR
jgi:hypothetical protein